ncbi:MULTISPECIES: outer membrane protein assembly factor BamE domain-containing protein [Xanthomonas]|uniref:Outer membrane protein assembly factor BamE n=1 Tax=Xanthomonas rydalmerensis TaxID=3046274 RepID=A0ABZ0JM69_9XANT|nr:MULTISPECIES: outer membrane protein assembly factor BamE [unclassified Xanthomonas]MBB5943418.1 hypothetical protein [Xanthomonas sp. 3307]WOS40877.1 outer membrane protein assembly factor BamE [Xanthomonas sp. DM-2023]WOS45062.1 outer membrane protein assembly factor BamE [Xanthomonas sp. DM-2023]WOS49241.1 outer membrane protein assembly factor BamE [Xanthomonas sp. DM-2023]WOS53421.1 outer membrane protein assembly factor BamE [Xanthomonas sp. DM-2023]
MRSFRSPFVLALALAAALPQLAAAADPKFSGFLCCNMRSDGSWISDSNYAEDGKRVIPAGTPVQVTGYGRYRVNVLIDGKKQSIGNDYSRDLGNEAFAQRYVVAQDPKLKLAAYPPKIREAIAANRVTKGMTREQVLMALGYPISSENPSLDAPLWRYWLDSFNEFQVSFDGAGKVDKVTADPKTQNLVWQP